MKKWMTVILSALPLLLAAHLNVEVTLPDWKSETKWETSSLPLLQSPGNPALPFYPVRVLLPMGEKVINVEITLENHLPERAGLSLDYVRQQQPVSQPAPDRTVKNHAVWEADAFYPAADFEYLGTQTWKGYQIALLNIYPWHYNPVTSRLAAAGTARIKILTEADAELARYQGLRIPSAPTAPELLSGFVLNPEQSAGYTRRGSHRPSTRYVNPNDPKKLVIITSQNRVEWFNAYAQWKNSRNIPTGIFTIESILSDYAGVDDPAKLRSFIEDAFLSWLDTGTPLEYVILAGDDEIIPVRGLFGQVGDTTDNWMPSDLYYGCLDGNWNLDGDNLWGEYPTDQPDLLPEVAVGRFPAESLTEFQRIMNKTMFYVDNNTFSNNIAAFFGENLNWNPVTWGGDYKDAVAVHLPEAYQLDTYYQRDGTYAPEIVINAINGGAGIMNHMGHANEVYLMGQSNGTVEALTNTEYGFLYTQGCYPAAFDQRTSGDGESIGEHFVTASGGLYAFIGNTRYGWYSPGNTNGASQQFDKKFFAGLFQQNLPQLGKAMEYSLLQNVNQAMQSGVMLWCYYETILFGDPSISVKPADPTLSCLALDFYLHDDSEGDGDGNLNPGETVRLYPRVRNLPGWGTAHNVLVTVEGLPAGFELLTPQISLPQLAAGSYIDSTLCIRFQLPNEMDFGVYNYQIRLQASDPFSGQVVCDRRYGASLEITLLDSHFPWDCFHAGKSAPVVGDLQFSQETQVLYVDVTGNGYFINDQGEQVSGFDFPTEENINRSFAAGPFEIINTLMYAYAFTSRTGKIFAVAHKDTTDFFYINYDTGSTLLYTPVLADIDNDGSSEAIAGAHNKKIYALNYENELLPGFPVQLSSPFSSELAVADLDGNGTREIIAGTANGQLWAIESSGAVRPGFPVQLGGNVTGAPLVLNNCNIVAGTPEHMYVVSPGGAILTAKPVSDDMASGAIAADINRNGELDIVFVTTSGDLYACRQDGSDLAGFPISTGGFFTCPPLAADLDGDLQYEIILQNHLNSIYIFNHDGSGVPGFPFIQNYNGATPATLADFDGDGNYELVSGYSNGVLVVKLRRPLGQMDAWTVYRGSLSRQGSFAATGFVGNDEQSSAASFRLEAAYPNPARQQATLAFSLPKAETDANLAIYNSKGQKVRTLFSGPAAKGAHSLVWNGRDDNGKPVAGGIYLYRLQSSSGSLSRKLLMFK